MFSLLFFCLDAKEKVTKEKIKAALFGLLRYFFPLKKKNSLRSNSFFFLTLQKAPTLHAQKVRPISDTTSLRSLEYMLSITGMSSRAKRRISKTSTLYATEILPPFGRLDDININERSTFYRPSRNIHLKQRSAFESPVGGPAFSGGA